MVEKGPYYRPFLKRCSWVLMYVANFRNRTKLLKTVLKQP